MSLRRALIRNPNQWRATFESWCTFKSCEFSESKKVEEIARDPFRLCVGSRVYYLTMLDSCVEFATVKASPAIVHVSREKGLGGSGIIIDSRGTVLTRTHNIFPLDADADGQINVNLLDRRNFLGTILRARKDPGLALLKIQSNIPLPIATLGSLTNCNGNNLISIEHPFRRGANPRPSSQNEVDEEGNLMLPLQGMVSKFEHKKYNMGCCGGPIVNLDGEVVGISTKIHIFEKIDNKTCFGTMDAMAIEEALLKVGYVEDGRPRHTIKWGTASRRGNWLQLRELNKDPCRVALNSRLKLNFFLGFTTKT